MKSDPFRGEAYRDWLTRAAGLLMLIALPASLLWLMYGYDFRHAKSVDATVVRVGMYAEGYSGDSPILTVRLADGSTRAIPTSWEAIKWCEPGSKIALVQSRSSLRVALRGCARNGLK